MSSDREKDAVGKDPAPSPVPGQQETGAQNTSHSSRGWREIEALREKAELKASLADVWDDDFDLDAEILAELDHTAEFFTTEDNVEEEDIPDEEELDELFDDEDEI